MGKARQYDTQYKVQAVKLTHDIGSKRAAQELGIPLNTLYGWMRAEKDGRLDCGARAPGSALTLSEEITMLRKQVRDQEKEIKRLKETNEFLEEASAFFAASRRKSTRLNG